jgi:hypothetical protein
MLAGSYFAKCWIVVVQSRYCAPKLAWDAIIEEGGSVTYLDEANVGALLAEALTADVEAVLADETSRVSAHAAVSTSLAIVLPQTFLRLPQPMLF